MALIHRATPMSFRAEAKENTDAEIEAVKEHIEQNAQSQDDTRR